MTHPQTSSLVCMEREDPQLYYGTNKTYLRGSVFKFTWVVTTPLVNRVTEKGLVRLGLRGYCTTDLKLARFECYLKKLSRKIMHAS